MPITTPWVTTQPTIAATGSPALGNGSCEFRSRRMNGVGLWAFRFIAGSTTSLGTGNCYFDTPAAYEFVTESIPTPAVAAIHDASVANHGQMGFAKLAGGYDWQLRGVAEPEIYEQTFVVGVLVWFGTTRFSASNPITLAAGDTLLAGNALEAFDN